MRRFAVVGLSSFGYFLTKFLSERGLPVMAIDNDEAKIDKVKPFIHKAIIADATDRETLANLGLQEFDVVVVSLGEKIDASILVVLYLRELGVKEIVAKAITEDHGKVLSIIGATTVVFPERDMANRLAHILEGVSLLDYIPLGSGYGIVELAPPYSFLGKTLRELDLRNRYGIQVIVVKEIIPENVIVVPRADHVIKDSDVLVVVGKEEDLRRVQSLK